MTTTDTGLREALEKLADDWSRDSVPGGTLFLAASTIAATLKAYPAEPAPVVTWRELKDALRPLKAFADQDEIALGAAADAVQALLAGSAK